jgi:hypothetical protein
LILLMSDSLNATVMDMVLVLTISAKPELLVDDELLELPRLPEVPVLLAFVPVPAEPVPDPLEPELPELLALEELEALLPEMSSPGLVDSSETTVPLAGAYRRVSSSAAWALRRLSRALSTDAWAEAMVAGEGVVVVVVPDRELLPLPLLLEFEPELALERCDPVWEPVPPVPVVFVRLRPGVVGLGAVTVVVVVVVVVVVGVVAVVGVGVVVGVVLLSDTNSVDAGWTLVLALLAPDDDVEVPPSVAVSWSSAAVRFSCAWSTLS